MEGKTTRTVADAILEQLTKWGVKRIYGVAGDAILHFLAAIARQTEITYVGVRHESAAGFMASAQGKYNGQIAICIGTSGPGFVTMLNGIADAAKDHIPLLVITGQVASKHYGIDMKKRLIKSK